MSKLKVNEIAPFSGGGIGVGTSSPDSSAIFDFESTTKGILAPRMTTAQRDAIVLPAEGLLVYNTDDHRLEHYSNGSWAVAGNGQQPVKNILRVVKNPVLNSGDFSSINTALASISDNSPSNQYVIDVGPGTYIEDPIHMKDYVYIVGAGFDSTIIQANNPNEHLIFGADFSCISSLMLTGVTLSGKALIYYASTTGTVQTSFWAEHIRFGSADTLGIADGTVAHSALFLNSCRYGGPYQFNTGFIARTGGATVGRVVVRNCTSAHMTAPYPQDMFVCDGSGCEINLKSAVARTGSLGGGGNGLRIRNGGTARVASLDLAGWSKGLWVENVGPAPLFLGGIIIFESNTIDCQIDHPGILGGMAIGADDDNKVILPPSLPNFGFVILGIEDGDISVSGRIKQFQNDGVFTDISTLLTDASPLGLLSVGELSIVSGTTIMADAGFGYLQTSGGSLRKVTWNASNITLPSNAVSYIYIDDTGVVKSSIVSPNEQQNIIIGRGVTDASSVVLLEESGATATHASTEIATALRKGLGPVYSDGGSVVTENGIRNLNVTAGIYYFGEKKFELAGASPISFSSFYRNGTGGQVITNGVTQVDNGFWDDGSGTLAALSAGFYAKHSLYSIGYSSGDTNNEKYFLVFSQNQYSALSLAQQGNISTPPSYFNDAVVLVASIIVQQGATNIVEIRDERPRIGFTASSVSAATFHSGLLGLTVGDDHPQYWRNDGTHLATGDFNLNSHALTGVTNVNGVVVENHHARHQPGGADAIPTAAASSLNANSTNTEGVSTSLARADHTHDLATGVASAQAPDQINAEGVSANLARADHVHNIPTAVATGLDGASTNTQGAAATFSRSDHTHAIAKATALEISTIQPDDIAAAGVSNNFARGDHKHAIVADAPIANLSASTTNAEGTATSFSRSDHSHAISTGTPVAQTPNQANSAGVSSNLVKSDHVHNIPTGVASGLDANSTNTQGSLSAFAQQDHTHAVATGVVSSQIPDQVNAAGTSPNLARADHMHNIATAAASTISGNANEQGTNSSFARSDHKHQLTAASASLDHVPQFDGTNWQAIYPESLLNISRAYLLTEDWITGTSNGIYGWVSTVIGGASAISMDTTNIDTNHVGIVNITAGNAANRTAILSLAQNHIVGGGIIVIECLFKVNTLTNAVYRIGFGDTYTGADFNDGIYVEYNSATSPNWLIKTASAGVRTSTTSAVAASVNSWHKLLITINAAASSISYSMDGVSLGTITTNIPTTAIGGILNATSLSGTTSTMFIDYYKIQQRFNTPR